MLLIRPSSLAVNWSCWNEAGSTLRCRINGFPPADPAHADIVPHDLPSRTRGRNKIVACYRIPQVQQPDGDVGMHARSEADWH